jgi:hypothetical protein
LLYLIGLSKFTGLSGEKMKIKRIMCVTLLVLLPITYANAVRPTYVNAATPQKEELQAAYERAVKQTKEYPDSISSWNDSKQDSANPQQVGFTLSTNSFSEKIKIRLYHSNNCVI